MAKLETERAALEINEAALRHPMNGNDIDLYVEVSDRNPDLFMFADDEGNRQPLGDFKPEAMSVDVVVLVNAAYRLAMRRGKASGRASMQRELRQMLGAAEAPDPRR